jgi:hypothetical protein
MGDFVKYLAFLHRVCSGRYWLYQRPQQEMEYFMSWQQTTSISVDRKVKPQGGITILQISSATSKRYDDFSLLVRYLVFILGTNQLCAVL